MNNKRIINLKNQDMKIVIILITILLSNVATRAQIFEKIPSINITVSSNKTSNLIFPYTIKSVDFGSSDLLAQKANGIDNILQVKATKENFEETNLSVITADGNLYSFLVNYSASPDLLNIRLKDLGNNLDNKGAKILIPQNINEAMMMSDCKKIINSEYNFLNKRDESNGSVLFLKGIYVDKDILYLKLQVNNLSNINYDIDMLNFFIKDKTSSKRTAVQELPQEPLLIYNNIGSIHGASNHTFIVALPKFTILDKKIFMIQLTEKNGGRNLKLKLKNRIIVIARTVTSISKG